MPFRKSHLCRLQLQSRQIRTTCARNVALFTKSRLPSVWGRCQQKQSLIRNTRKNAGGARRSKSSAPAADAATEAVPPYQTLRWVAFTTGVPFIGFGFMDNAILIIAGDAIDTSLGVTLGISTLCAAAIGNIISDLAGIGFAASIEDFCATTLKLPVPILSTAQRQMRSVRMASQVGTAIGVTVGCVLGLIPLLFIDSNKADRLREKARLERLCLDVLNEAKSLVGAESTVLYLRVDKDEGRVHSKTQKRASDEILPDHHLSVKGAYLYAMYYVEPQNRSKSNPASVGTSTKNAIMRMVSNRRQDIPDSSSDSSKSNSATSKGSDNESGDAKISPAAVPESFPSSTIPRPASISRVVPVGKGIISRAVLTGTTWNITGNLINEPDFYPLSIKTGAVTDQSQFRDCAVVPILDGQGRVIAVLEAFNKECEDESYPNSGSSSSSNDVYTGGFTDMDVEILMSLASHVSVSLQKIYQDGEKEEDLGLKETIRILNEGKTIRRSRTIATRNSDGEI